MALELLHNMAPVVEFYLPYSVHEKSLAHQTLPIDSAKSLMICSKIIRQIV